MDGFISDLGYKDALEKRNAIDALRAKVSSIEEEIHGLVVGGHLDESDASIACGSLQDWFTDQLGNWDYDDLRERIESYGNNNPTRA